MVKQIGFYHFNIVIDCFIYILVHHHTNDNIFVACFLHNAVNLLFDSGNSF